jgi:prepilin-type processing-associated H-X9-DG protein
MADGHDQNAKIGQFVATSSAGSITIAAPTTASPPILEDPQGQSRIIGRHFEGTNVGFFDGHVKWLQLEKLRAKNATSGNYSYFTKIAD